MDQERTEFVNNYTEIMQDLRDILERTKQIEDRLIHEIRSQVSTTDFYKPDKETEQPKKRFKPENLTK